MYGATSAAANGHPSSAPAANHSTPRAVCSLPERSMKAAAPSMAAYMAKLDGRYAVAAWNMPDADADASRKYSATRGPRAAPTDRNRRVSHAAQPRARLARRA